nr:DMT family transporter [Shimazuella soli]
MGAMCYGSISTITKLAFQRGFSPAEISSGQVTFGCLVLWLFALPMWKKLRCVPRKSIFLLTLTGAVFGLTEIFYTLCLSKIPASIAVILLFQSIWMTQIVQMIQEKTWPSKALSISLMSIVLGTICASGFSMHDLKGLNMVGVALGLCSALSYTASMVVSGSVTTEVPSLLRSSFMVTGQMLFIFLVYPPTVLFTASMGQGLWFWIGLLGMIGIVATTFAYNKGMPQISPGLAGVLVSIELPMVILLSSTILKENVSLIQWMGVGCILIGIILTSVKTNQEKTPASISPID